MSVLLGNDWFESGNRLVCFRKLSRKITKKSQKRKKKSQCCKKTSRKHHEKITVIEGENGADGDEVKEIEKEKGYP